jgi:hypothetical protein
VKQIPRTALREKTNALQLQQTVRQLLNKQASYLPLHHSFLRELRSHAKKQEALLEDGSHSGSEPRVAHRQNWQKTLKNHLSVPKSCRC